MSGSLRFTAGPVNDRKLAGLIEPAVAAAGMDLELVRLTVAGKRRQLRIVVDSDQGVSHNDLDGVSRKISAVLDASNALGDVPYTLEISSPGVDRPLTEPRHWRRARGRLVRVKVRGPGEGSTVSGEGFVEGRVLAADADGVTLGLAGGERRFPYADMGAGSVQVEFGRIPDAELDDFNDPELDDAVFENDTELGAGGDGH
jgi:ribosome maturation factor RimP